jgi:hypothetical protein
MKQKYFSFLLISPILTGYEKHPTKYLSQYHQLLSWLAFVVLLPRPKNSRSKSGNMRKKMFNIIDLISKCDSRTIDKQTDREMVLDLKPNN